MLHLIYLYVHSFKDKSVADLLSGRYDCFIRGSRKSPRVFDLGRGREGPDVAKAVVFCQCCVHHKRRRDAEVLPLSADAREGGRGCSTARPGVCMCRRCDGGGHGERDRYACLVVSKHAWGMAEARLDGECGES